MIAMKFNEGQVHEIQVELSKASARVSEALSNIYEPMLSMDKHEQATALVDALQSISVALGEINRPIKE